MHGYAIAQWIEQQTPESSALPTRRCTRRSHRLEHKGLIDAEWGLSENNRRAKSYSLTRAGRQQRRTEVTEIRRYVSALFKVLEAAPS